MKTQGVMGIAYDSLGFMMFGRFRQRISHSNKGLTGKISNSKEEGGLIYGMEHPKRRPLAVSKRRI